MARFYARFDSGSNSIGGWTTDTETTNLDLNSPNGYFTRLRIAAGSASAALLRDGLIASRSAVSIDFYEELDPVNQDGGLGIFFPSDQIQIVAGVLTASAYTASAGTTQGIFTPLYYRTRPTASITSAQTTLIGPTTPLDSGSVTYTTYLNASAAVEAVLNVVQTGAGVLTTPYLRRGNQQSRTFHSIWHDPDLQYFAWDDFTPGVPQNVNLVESSSTDFYYTNNFRVKLDWASGLTPYQFRNDEQAPVFISFNFTPDGDSPVQGLKTTRLAAFSKEYTWTINQSNITENKPHTVSYSVKFRDAQIDAEGGFNVALGDGAAATGAGTAINYIRLHLSKVRSGGSKNPSNEWDCSTFTNAEVDMYTTKSLVSTDLATTDRLYATTDRENPTDLAFATYAVTFPTTNAAYKTVVTMDSNGTIQTVEPKCVGEFPAGTTTTTTTTGACTSFSYAIVNSLTACSVGSYPETGRSNTGQVVGGRFYENAGCTTPLASSFVQLSDGTNYELDSNGTVLAINNQGC